MSTRRWIVLALFALGVVLAVVSADGCSAPPSPLTRQLQAQQDTLQASSSNLGQQLATAQSVAALQAGLTDLSAKVAALPATSPDLAPLQAQLAALRQAPAATQPAPDVAGLKAQLAGLNAQLADVATRLAASQSADRFRSAAQVADAGGGAGAAAGTAFPGIGTAVGYGVALLMGGLAAFFKRRADQQTAAANGQTDDAGAVVANIVASLEALKGAGQALTPAQLATLDAIQRTNPQAKAVVNAVQGALTAGQPVVDAALAVLKPAA